MKKYFQKLHWIWKVIIAFVIGNILFISFMLMTMKLF